MEREGGTNIDDLQRYSYPIKCTSQIMKHSTLNCTEKQAHKKRCAFDLDLLPSKNQIRLKEGQKITQEGFLEKVLPHFSSFLIKQQSNSSKSSLCQ